MTGNTNTYLTDSVLLLAAALTLFGLAPGVYWLAQRRRWILSGLNGFVLTSVGVLVLLHIVPHAVEAAGWAAVLGLVAGLAGPLLLEQLSGHAHERAHSVVLWVALGGLTLHAAVDGVALAGVEFDHTGGHLAEAVVLHRLPVGLAIWWLVRPTKGWRWAALVLGCLGIATIVGFALAGTLTTPLGSTGVAIFQAVVAGSLLHVLAHQYGDHAPAPRWHLAETLGAVLGLVLVFLIPAGGSAGHSETSTLLPYGRRLLSLALESAPALLLGFALAGIIKELTPQRSFDWLGRGSSLSQATRGMIFGTPIPICSCGIVPLYQSLVDRGVPASAAMAFLVATPEIGVESILLSWSLLGGELTAVRLTAAMIVALGVGWIVGRYVPRRPSGLAMAIGGDDHPAPTRLGRLGLALRYGFVDVVGDTAPWLLAGLLIAAALDPVSVGQWAARLPRGLDVLVFGLVGIPVYVCASAATPLAAALILVGISPGAALAFLLSGPATNVTTFGILSNLHGRRVALFFGMFILALTIGLGLVINWLIPTVTLPLGDLSHPESAGLLKWVCLGGVSLAFAGSLLRLGPRAFVGTVLTIRPSLGNPEQ